MSNILLSIYPNTKGFGYVTLANVKSLFGFGVVQVRPVVNCKIRNKISQFMDFYEPLIIVIQEANGKISRQGKRIKDLIENVKKDVANSNVQIVQYTRDQITDVFEQFGAKTKYEISQQLIKWFPELQSKAPKPNVLLEAEYYHMGMFDALALAITHFYLTE